MARKRHSTWGSNEPAGKGRRRLRWWADMHDGRGYRRCSKTIDGTRRDGDEELARIRASHAHDMASPTLQQAFEAAGVGPIPFSNLRSSWRTVMRWELGVDEDKVERMMGHAGKSVGEIHYDRPRDEYFAQTVADAYLRRRAG